MTQPQPLPLPTIATRIMAFIGVSFPRSLIKLDGLLQNANTRPDAVGGLLLSDPMLSAMVLGHANAVRPVATVSEAIQQVGMASVLGLVRECPPIPEDRRTWMFGYWEEANATAILTRVIARYLQAHRRYPGYLRVNDEVLHLAGLLHNLGGMLAILSFPEHYAQAGIDAEKDPEERAFRHLFKERLGLATGDLGYMLARNWHLPPLIADLNRFHTHPLRAERDLELVAIVHVARTIARGCGHCSGLDRYLDPIDDGVLAAINMTTGDFDLVINAFLDEWEELEKWEAGAI
jgi:HD-like signal output (HDOD) protein